MRDLIGRRSNISSKRSSMEETRSADAVCLADLVILILRFISKSRREEDGLDSVLRERRLFKVWFCIKIALQACEMVELTSFI